MDSQQAGQLTFRGFTPVDSGDEEARLALSALWFGMVNDGLDGVVFYDGGVRCLGDFIAFMSDRSNHVYGAYLDGEPAGLWWLNNFSGQTAMIHFCVLRHALPQAERIGRAVTEHMLQHYAALVGMTPKPFRHALRFVRALGFERVGVLPCACRLSAAGGRCVDGVLTVLTAGREV